MSELFYLERGDPTQPTLVFLHGMGMTSWMWEPQLAAFGHAYHLLAPDLPGMGHSVAQGPFTLTGAAEAVARLIRERCGGRAHVCGLSLGAVVALQLALDAPDCLESLTLSGGQVQPNRALLLFQSATIRLASQRSLTKQLASLIPDSQPAAMRQHLQEDMAQMGKRGLVQVMDAMSGLHLRARLGEVHMPTLVLCGARDTPNLKAARELARGITHARLEIVPDAGHILNLEQPDRFNQAMQSFLAQQTLTDIAR